MMGLFGNIALTKAELPSDHPGRTFLKDAEKCMDRAVCLTKQLLTFAKGGEPVKKAVNLCSLVEESAKFDLSGSPIMLVYQNAPDLWLANADKGQIQQVLSNLTINARQAMLVGGHLYITLNNAELLSAAVPGLPSGKYIQITVRDEGTGIDPKQIDQIFDPYFTTKSTGCGLGLATSFSIIMKHGGHIGVESVLGKGTTFTIYLPASEVQTLPQNGPPAAETPSLKPGTRILILDDEEYIRIVTTRWLKKAGGVIETAETGRKAIDMYQQALKAGNPFDVIILDLNIPGGMGGQEVLKEILMFDPNVRAIVSSGYAEGAEMSKYAFYGFKSAIAKPYTESELQGVLGKVLK
jgi:CheY-like chemotaxis protein